MLPNGPREAAEQLCEFPFHIQRTPRFRKSGCVLQEAYKRKPNRVLIASNSVAERRASSSRPINAIRCFALLCAIFRIPLPHTAAALIPQFWVHIAANLYRQSNCVRVVVDGGLSQRPLALGPSEWARPRISEALAFSLRAGSFVHQLIDVLKRLREFVA
jgi:hypothetical protein